MQMQNTHGENNRLSGKTLEWDDDCNVVNRY